MAVTPPTLVVPLLLWRSERVRSLSARERVVVTLVACGFDNDQIAGILGVCRSTIRAQLYSSMSKLGCRNRTQVAMVAMLAGIVDAEHVVDQWRRHSPEIVE